VETTEWVSLVVLALKKNGKLRVYALVEKLHFLTCLMQLKMSFATIFDQK